MLRSTVRVVLLIAVIACGAGLPVLAGDAPEFRVATFQSEVTLPLGDLLYAKPLATVEHPLLAKGIVVDDGGKRYVLCAVDWCTMRNSTHAMFQNKIAAAAGVEPSHVAVHCVHQHFAQRVLPGEFVAVAGYGLATPGYVCTEKAFEEGGYEPSASDVVPESEKVLKQAIRQLLTAE